MKFEIIPVRQVDSVPTRDLLKELGARIGLFLLYLRHRYANLLGIFAVLAIAFIAFFAGKALPGAEPYERPSAALADLPTVCPLYEDPTPAAIQINENHEVSENAPLPAEDLPDDLTLRYIKQYTATARQEMLKYGIPASISLAQGLIESRYGTSTLAKKNNNHFGIKCFAKRCKKGHCTNHTDDSHKDFFRKYTKPWESWRAHSLILCQGRYKPLFKKKDYKSWAYGLERLGYATDRSYAEKLIGTIEKYRLYNLDK